MEIVSFTKFLDFCGTVGLARVREVETHQHPPYDLYEDFRTAIVEIVSGAAPIDRFDAFVATIKDTTRRDNYRRCGAGLRRFLRFAKGATWVQPPVVRWPIGEGVSLQVNPEIGLARLGKTAAFKVHPRVEPPSQDRVALACASMRVALIEEGWCQPAQLVVGVLDVQRGKVCLEQREDVLRDAEILAWAEGAAYAEVIRLLAEEPGDGID